MTPVTYLHIRGTLRENMVYTPGNGYESTRPEERDEGNPEFQLVLLDREEGPLVRVAPRVRVIGCGSVNDPRRYRVRGTLPLHPNGATYELWRGDLLLHRAAIASEPPKLSSVRCQRTKKRSTLRWRGPEQENISYDVVAQMDSGRRIMVARNLTKPTYAVDLDRIPAAGKGRIVIVARDGVRSSDIESERITLEERAPTLRILSPQDHVKMSFGLPISVLGSCWDASGKPCPPENAGWFLGGELFAHGSFIAALENLSPGKHKLTFAYGIDKLRVETSITFVIEKPDESYREWVELVQQTDGNG